MINTRKLKATIDVYIDMKEDEKEEDAVSVLEEVITKRLNQNYLRENSRISASNVKNFDIPILQNTLVDYKLDESQKLKLIGGTYNLLYNTDLDVEEFSNQFYYLVGNIINDRLPIELKQLKEYKELVKDILREEN